MKGKRASSNLRSVNPFAQLGTLLFGPGRDFIDRAGGFLATIPEDQAMRTQDRVRPENERFDMKFGFKSGFDKALQSEKVASSFRRANRSPEMQEGWRPGDAWTTRKTDAPAQMTKRARPTPADAIQHKRNYAVNTVVYPTAASQRFEERMRAEALANASAFERGLEIAKRK